MDSFHISRRQGIPQPSNYLQAEENFPPKFLAQSAYQHCKPVGMEMGEERLKGTEGSRGPRISTD